MNLEPFQVAGASGFTDEQWETKLPMIPWREPMPVTCEGAQALACRFCIARYGLKGRDVERLHQTRAEFDAHMQEHHPRP